MGCAPSSQVGPLQVAPAPEAAPPPDGPAPQECSTTGHSHPPSGSGSRPSSDCVSRPGSRPVQRGNSAAKRVVSPRHPTRQLSGKLRSAEVVLPTHTPQRPPSSRPRVLRQVTSPEGEFFDPLKLDTSYEPKKEAPTSPHSQTVVLSTHSTQRFSLASPQGRKASAARTSSGGSEHAFCLSQLHSWEKACPSFLHCPSCCQPFTSAGFAVPHVLRCGHTYCAACLERACEHCPGALQCGLCPHQTPLDTQGSLALPRNTVLMEILSSKQLTRLMSSRRQETCAECEGNAAVLYCSDCAAAFCEFCSKQQHQGSKVRAKHHPLPIKLKPRAQPTCPRHPGQNCMLYCETERQPMCVLCKFYGQHRFHSFELLNQAAGKYGVRLSEETSRLQELDKAVKVAIEELVMTEKNIVESARHCEERLERHFGELRSQLLAALERRETVLLALVDQEVEGLQEEVARQREELSLLRARVLGTMEEGYQLTSLDAVTALLERHHVDSSLDLLQRVEVGCIDPSPHTDITLHLPIDVGVTLVSSIGHHGSIQCAPPRPGFVHVHAEPQRITLSWAPLDRAGQPLGGAGRGWTYTLQCYNRAPRGQPPARNLLLSPQMGNSPNLLYAPSLESGFEDGSAGPSGSVSMVTVGSAVQDVPKHAKPHRLPRPHSSTFSEDAMSGTEEVHSPQHHDPAPRGPPLFSKAIRLPLPTNTSPSARLVSPPISEPAQPLNLPPLVTRAVTPDGRVSVANSNGSGSGSSGVYADSIDAAGVPTDIPPVTSLGLPPLRTSSVGVVSESRPHPVEECTPTEGAWVGMPFEQVYSGADTHFTYTGAISMVTYYFRVRCYDNSRWGPWSAVIKCCPGNR